MVILSSKCFESLSNDSNLHLNASNAFRMLRVPFELFEFWFGCFESFSNCLKLHSMFRMSFEGLEFAFNCFESRLTGSNLHSNASNLVSMVRIHIWMLWIWFKWLKFAFESFRMLPIPVEWLQFWFKCFECHLNGYNLHSNASNVVWRVRICIRMLRIWLKCLEVRFNCFDSL